LERDAFPAVKWHHVLFVVLNWNRIYMLSKHPESGADATEEDAFDFVELAGGLRFGPDEGWFGVVLYLRNIFMIENFESLIIFAQNDLSVEMLEILNTSFQAIVIFLAKNTVFANVISGLVY
jgi:hypothetical protein